MKRLIYTFILLLCCAKITHAASQPQTFTRQQITYIVLDAHHASVRTCQDQSEDIYIPDSAFSAEDGITYCIIGIEAHAFAGCRKMTTISLPATIEYIGAEAFDGTAFYQDKNNWDEDGRLWIGEALISVKPSGLSAFYAIPEGAGIVAAGVLGDNGKVRRLILPNGIRIIPDKAFLGCRKLRFIQIPTSVERIGRKAFVGTALYASDVNWTNGILYADNCAVDSRTIPQNLTFRVGTRLMADGLLQGNRTLRNVWCPEGMEQISTEAFADCRNLQYAYLPDSLSIIRERAFMGCHNLRGGKLFPAELRLLGAGAFYECASLDSVILPQKVDMIPAACFFRCEQISDLQINSGCRYIGLGAFIGCSGLTELTFPQSLQGMDTGAFSGCSNLRTVNMSNCKLEVIPSYAFSGCTKLTEVLLPTICNRINRESFSYCPALDSVITLDSISIHPEAFLGSPTHINED